MLYLGDLNKYLQDEIFINHCRTLAEQYKTNNRSFEEVLKHTAYGEAVEELASAGLSLQRTDFSTAKYDATKDGLKIEIKHTVKDSKWWNFKMSSYKYFLDCSKDLDYIILCYVQGTECYLKYIANAKTFKDYIKESNFKDHYYNVDKAIAEGQCYEVNNKNDIKLERKNEMKEQIKTTIQQFEDVRKWGSIRGINGADFQHQFQRALQEIVEIHEAYIENDMDEVQDAIGDSIVTLINLAVTVGYNAENCLEKAFNVIKLRKGLNKNGSFVRYGKLNEEDRKICDAKQGNTGNEYFEELMLHSLEPKDFLK